MKVKDPGSLVAASLCFLTGIVVLLSAYWKIKPNDPVFVAGMCLGFLMCSMGAGFALAGFGIISVSGKDRHRK